MDDLAARFKDVRGLHVSIVSSARHLTVINRAGLLACIAPKSVFAMTVFHACVAHFLPQLTRLCLFVHKRKTCEPLVDGIDALTRSMRTAFQRTQRRQWSGGRLGLHCHRHDKHKQQRQG
jgi:hypothetical protein